MDSLVARCALHHYRGALPAAKGKPKENEWTVYAAIVAVRDTSSDQSVLLKDDSMSENSWVVSCATGTKCSNIALPTADKDDDNEMSSKVRRNPQQTETMILRDCHAEVLCRRGLLRVLWEEIQNYVMDANAEQFARNQDEHRLLELVSPPMTATSQRRILDLTFQIRRGITLHLYVSDSPCGDASIYPIVSSKSSSGVNATTELNFTGAKVIVSEDTGVAVEDCGGVHQLLETSKAHELNDQPKVAREEIQLLGKLRTKSARSNIPCQLRSLCMSCSDKIVRWSVLGLQGALLSKYIPAPIRFTSVVVSLDPRASSSQAQREALERALTRRVQGAVEYLTNRISGGDKRLLEWLSSSKNGPRVHVVSGHVYSRGKAMMEAALRHGSSLRSPSRSPGTKRKRNEEDDSQQSTTDSRDPLAARESKNDKSFSPCGISVNWFQSCKRQGAVELIVGGRGLRQGKKPKRLEDFSALASRLSRHALMQAAQQVHDARALSEGISSDSPEPLESHPSWYEETKQSYCDVTLGEIRSIVFKGGPLSGWLTT